MSGKVSALATKSPDMFHRADLNTDAARFHEFEYRLSDFKEEARAVHRRASVLILRKFVALFRN